MGNIIAERIRNIKLTKSQEKIADYCIRNLEWVGMSSSMEVANAIGVSDVSMTRFARAIGYAGYTELKNDIYNSIARQASGADDELSLLDRSNVRKQKYGDNITIEDYFKMIRSNLEQTIKFNSEESINNIIDLLMAAEHRYVVGFRGCIGAASRCAWNMRLAVDHVITVTDENPDSVARLQDISDKDCLLMYSYTRIYRLDKNIIELAHGRGAKICLITNSTVSPMIKYADIVLYVETETPSFFHSTMAITMLSEYLVIGMAQKCNGAYKERLKERDSATGYMRL